MAVKYRILLLLLLGAGLTAVYLDYFNASKIKSSAIARRAELVVVRIEGDNSSGSGVIIAKEDNTYRVVTNCHVVDRQNTYQIQTADGNLHLGTLAAVSSQDDLAIVRFESDRSYPIAVIDRTSPSTNIPLLAAGFPFDSDRLQITSGKLALQLVKPLKYGYQIGYTNEVYQGMSGGAILNTVGEVIGINGRSSYPIIPDYQYRDKTYPDRQLQQQMVQLSWGIPVARAIELLATDEAGNFLTSSCPR